MCYVFFPFYLLLTRLLSCVLDEILFSSLRTVGWSCVSLPTIVSHVFPYIFLHILKTDLSKLAYGLSTVVSINIVHHHFRKTNRICTCSQISHGIWPLVYSCRSTVYPPLPPTSRFLSLLYTNVARNRHCWCNPIHIQAVSRCTRDFCPWRSGLRWVHIVLQSFYTVFFSRVTLK